jgi:hypothetical protein
MKNLVYLVFVVFFATSFTSCSLFDVEIETTMSADLEIETDDTALKSAAEEYKIDSYTTINPMDYGDVAENEDKIDRITADGIIATVEYVSTSEIVFKAGTEIVIKNDDESAIWEIGNDILVQKGTEFLLEDINNIYDTVTDILTSMDVFIISIYGKASEPEAVITLRFDIDCTVTGNPF